MRPVLTCEDAEAVISCAPSLVAELMERACLEVCDIAVSFSLAVGCLARPATVQAQRVAAVGDPCFERVIAFANGEIVAPHVGWHPGGPSNPADEERDGRPEDGRNDRRHPPEISTDLGRSRARYRGRVAPTVAPRAVDSTNASSPAEAPRRGHADTFADTPLIFDLRGDPAERENPCASRGFSTCRRRDSNPRHADYDSAALTD